VGGIGTTGRPGKNGGVGSRVLSKKRLKGEIICFRNPCFFQMQGRGRYLPYALCGEAGKELDRERSSDTLMGNEERGSMLKDQTETSPGKRGGGRRMSRKEEKIESQQEHFRQEKFLRRRAWEVDLAKFKSRGQEREGDGWPWKRQRGVRGKSMEYFLDGGRVTKESPLKRGKKKT